MRFIVSLKPLRVYGNTETTTFSELSILWILLLGFQTVQSSRTTLWLRSQMGQLEAVDSRIQHLQVLRYEPARMIEQSRINKLPTAAPSKL